MKLKGVLSTKTKRAVYLASKARYASLPAEDRHKPIIQTDGTLKCSGCNVGMRWSPLAFEAHLNGIPPTDAVGNTYVTGPNDPWTLSDSTSSDSPVKSPLDDQEWRFDMINAYRAQQRRNRQQAYIAEGASPSMADR